MMDRHGRRRQQRVRRQSLWFEKLGTFWQQRKQSPLWLKFRQPLAAFLMTLAFLSAHGKVSQRAIREFLGAASPVLTEAAVTDIQKNDFLKSLLIIQLNYKGIFSLLALVLFLLGLVYFRKVMGLAASLPPDRRLHRISLLLSFFYSGTYLLGRSFLTSQSWDPLFGSTAYVIIGLLNLAGLLYFSYYPIKLALAHSQSYLTRHFGQGRAFSKQKLAIFTCIFLALAWLPYLLIFFPGNINLDAFSQIQQALGLIPMTSSHPPLASFFFGGLFQLGRFFGGDNGGLFLIAGLQVAAAVFLLAEVLSWFALRLGNLKVYAASLLFFAFFPFWPLRFYIVEKDTVFILACLAFLYAIFRMLDGGLDRKALGFYLGSAFIMCAFRNNAIYMVLLTLPFLVWQLSGVARRQLTIAGLTVLLLYGGLSGLVGQTMGIEKGSVVEGLSLPLQHTARYVQKNRLTAREKAIIDKVVDFQVVKNHYNPETVDPVKFYAKTSTMNTDLKAYMGLWFGMFFKDPLVYVEATLNATYGYVYPERLPVKDGTVYTEFAVKHFGRADAFKLSQIKELKFLRQLTERFFYLLMLLPGISLLFGTGIYTWILVFLTGLLVFYRKYRALIPFLPVVMVILACIGSPVNAYMRYMLSVIIAVPFLIQWTILQLGKAIPHSERTSEPIGE